MVLSHFTTTRPCAHYFANTRTEHVARRIFRHAPRERDLLDLGRMEACLQRPGLRGLVVRYDRHQAALRRARLRWERQAARAAMAARAATRTASLKVSRPATSATPATTSGYVIPSYVVQCESGGNARAVSPFSGGGLYGILDSSWQAFGGTAYAAHPYDASPTQQGVVAQRILSSQGPSAWQCWK